MSYGNSGTLANTILADQPTNNITVEQLRSSKINIIMVTVLNATVTLPASAVDYIIWVEDLVSGGGNITVNQAA